RLRGGNDDVERRAGVILPVVAERIALPEPVWIHGAREEPRTEIRRRESLGELPIRFVGRSSLLGNDCRGAEHEKTDRGLQRPSDRNGTEHEETPSKDGVGARRGEIRVRRLQICVPARCGGRGSHPYTYG